MYSFKGQRTLEGFTEFIKGGYLGLDAKPVPKKRDPNAPSFVKLYALWCGHCKAMAPAYDALSQDLDGRVSVGTVDVTENWELGERFGVQGFPTLVFFADGLMYEYSGKRTLDALMTYVIGGQAMDAMIPAAPGVWFIIKFMAPCSQPP